MRNNKRKNRPIDTVITVRAEDCGHNPDKMVRRFIKTVKRDGILEEMRQRRYYRKPTEIRAEEKRKRQQLIKKNNQQREALSTTREYLHKRKRRK